MDRLNYYFRQKVTEAELDQGFALAEAADKALMTDLDMIGVITGLVVTERGAGPNLSVDVSAGTAYDKNGARMRITGTQNVDVSVDESAVTTAVTTPGNSKIISVFLKFKRVLTDPRTDGNSTTVYFSEAESFEFVVRQSGEAVTPTPVGVDGTYILLADITRAEGQTTIVNANIDTTAANRREEVFKITNGATHRLQRGRVELALSDLLGWLNSEIDDRVADVDAEEARAMAAETVLANDLAAHLADTTDAHDSTAISYPGFGWIGATDVGGALDEIVNDLASQVGGSAGADRIGATGSAATYVFGLSAGSLASQLIQLKAYLDEGPSSWRVDSFTGNATLTSHRFVLVDTNGGAVSLTLPAPTLGRTIEFKDKKGTWGTNNFTLIRAGGEKIDGVAGSRVFSANWGSVRVWSDGTDWYII